MEFSAKQIAEYVQGVVVGDENTTVQTFAKIEEADLDENLKWYHRISKEFTEDFVGFIYGNEDIYSNNVLAFGECDAFLTQAAYYFKKDIENFNITLGQQEEFDNIKELLMDPDYSSIISLMLDGEIKVKGEEYLIFVYEAKNLDEYFNSILLDIEKTLKNLTNVCYYSIITAHLLQSCNFLRSNYDKKKKKKE